jgi:hypothetical protein
MIFCHDKIYAKVWKIKPAEKYLDLRISTSEKDRDGNYINSTWFPRCIGHSFNSLKDKLKEGDRIIITLSKFTNEKYTANDGSIKSAFRFIILEASIDEPQEAVPPKPENSAAAATPSTTDTLDDCPW